MQTTDNLHFVVDVPGKEISNEVVKPQEGDECFVRQIWQVEGKRERWNITEYNRKKPGT